MDQDSNAVCPHVVEGQEYHICVCEIDSENICIFCESCWEEHCEVCGPSGSQHRDTVTVNKIRKKGEKWPSSTTTESTT